jgi:hypothetical protein
MDIKELEQKNKNLQKKLKELEEAKVNKIKECGRIRQEIVIMALQKKWKRCCK